MQSEFDEAVLQAFLENQTQLFDEVVAETVEEAEDFLLEVMAVVCENADEVWAYFDEEGVDMEGADKNAILEADEVFDIGDGRYLIVEA